MQEKDNELFKKQPTEQTEGQAVDQDGSTSCRNRDDIPVVCEQPTYAVAPDEAYRVVCPSKIEAQEATTGDPCPAQPAAAPDASAQVHPGTSKAPDADFAVADNTHATTSCDVDSCAKADAESDCTVNHDCLAPSGKDDKPNGHEPKKRWFSPKKVLSIALSAVLFGTVAAGTFQGVNRLFPQNSTTVNNGLMQTATLADDKVYAGEWLDISDMVSAVMPAMVSINCESVEEIQSYFGRFSGTPQTKTVKSSGSGIIIGENDNELLIVTNNHVIEDATTLSVSFVNETTCSATVKGTDADNDLAVIAVKRSDLTSETQNAIKAATMGDSSALKVGEQVVAIGNALGYGQSVTTGIVSALNRQIDTTDAVMIQTDAAINPGNSGGALLNRKGEVIGINSAKFSSTAVEGMGYAISVSTANPIIEKLMNRTTRQPVSADQSAYIGISGSDISAYVSSAYGVPQGVYVTQVVSGSPAEAAGITEKSILTHFDGQRIKTVSDLQKILTGYAAGETVEITLQEQGDNRYTEKTISITLGSADTH